MAFREAAAETPVEAVPRWADAEEQETIIGAVRELSPAAPEPTKEKLT
jgi:hypothetical protein